MHISIINSNWIDADAIGQSINKQVEFFQRRGDRVRVYTLSPPEGVAGEFARLGRVTTAEALVAGEEAHFNRSQLYIFHYPGRHALIESMMTLERGVVILYYHNVTPPELWHHPEEREHLAFSLSSLPRVLAHTDLIVTPSEYNALSLQEAHGADPARIRVLPLSVSLDRFAPRPPQPELVRRYRTGDRRVLLFVGRVASNKRIDLLIDAVAALKESHPEVLLLVVGENDDNLAQRQLTAELNAQVARLGLQEQVQFTGRVADVAPFFNLADLYVTASLHEGFGVPLIEAMASGVPVVASDITAHPLVLQEAGLLVEPDSAAALAEGVAHLLDSPEEREAVIRRGRDRVVAFSEPEVALQWSQIVAEATSWLPRQIYPRYDPSIRNGSAAAPESVAPPPEPSSPEGSIPPAIEHRLNRLRDRAVTMDRDYVVRSDLPLVATVRHHLTSHLHEPYLDPTFDRQTSWNQELVALLRQLVEQGDLGGSEPEQAADTHQWAFERLEQLRQDAVPMDRSYQVRSQIPLVATVRRHLTSHLHEPYVNPTFERQAAFNHEVVSLLRTLLERTSAPDPLPADELHTWRAQLEAEHARRHREVQSQLSRLEEMFHIQQGEIRRLEAALPAQKAQQERLEQIDMQVQLLGQQVTLLLAERNQASDAVITSLRESAESLHQSVQALRERDG